MFDCSYPRISYNIFKEYKVFNLYKETKVVMPTNMPESRGHKVSFYMFVDAELAGYNSTRRR